MNPVISAKQFQSLVLTWFKTHGRTHLPWQQQKTPYKVWLSEIMLQQTQVNTVIPYYQRFIGHFPNIHALAHAETEQVFFLWAGLGYYQRARHAHQTAKIIVEKYAGHFPETIPALRELPGIGESTAGAIVSLAFNKYGPILDGNAKRVLARFNGLQDALNAQMQKLLWNFAHYYTPKRPAAYTQAIMDLGSLICTRAHPKCLSCPLNHHCIAYKKNLTEKIPLAKKSPSLPKKQKTFFIFKHGSYILLSKRPMKGIWGGLWSFPEKDGNLSHKNLELFCEKHFSIPLLSARLLRSFKHTFTHFHLKIFPIVFEVTTLFEPSFLKDSKMSFLWYNLKKPIALGLPKPISSIINEIINEKTNP